MLHSSRSPVQWNWPWKVNFQHFTKPWRNTTYTVLNKECILSRDRVSTTSIRNKQTNKQAHKQTNPFFPVYWLFAEYQMTSRHRWFKSSQAMPRELQAWKHLKKKQSTLPLVYMWIVKISWVNQEPWSTQYIISTHGKLEKNYSYKPHCKNEPLNAALVSKKATFLP